MQVRCPRAPSPLVLAVPRPRLHGLRAGAASDDDESDADLDLHWPQGPPAEHGWEQHVSSAKLRKGDFFHKAGADELPNVSTIWKRLHGSSADLAGRWEDEHVLTGSILSTWAVLGTAISGASTYSRLKVQRIPLVRAKLPDGGAIVGVRVRHERLQEVRYVLSALHDAKTKTTSENKDLRAIGCTFPTPACKICYCTCNSMCPPKRCLLSLVEHPFGVLGPCRKRISWACGS